MSLCAIIPTNLMQSANDALEQQGYGGGNFSVPLYANGGATYAGLHAWNDAPFVAAVKAIAGVAWEESEGDPTTRFNALVNAQGVKWGANAPQYPTSGTVLAGQMYRHSDGNTYQVIQPYSVDTYPLHPSTYPALIVMARDPYRAYEWYQTGQFDAFKLLNPFTNQNDECTYGGKKWYVTKADGAGNNTYRPGDYGWSETDPTPNIFVRAWNWLTGLFTFN